MRLLSLIVLVACCLASGVAEADPTPERRAADRALATEDPKALEAIANADHPDPWLVALDLLVRGEADAAKRLAAAATAKHTSGLPAAVAAWPTEAKAAPACKHLLDARAAIAARETGRAMACLDAVISSGAGPLLTVEARVQRASLLKAGGALPAAATAFAEAARDAETAGWLTRASDLWYQAGLALWTLEMPAQRETMLAHFRSQGAAEKKLESKAGMGRGYYRAAVALELLGRYEEALAELERAVPLLKADDDKEYAGRALGLQATLVDRLGDAPHALELSCEASSLLEAADGAGLAHRFQIRPASHERALLRRLMTCASFATKLGRVERATTYVTRMGERLKGRPESRIHVEVAALRAIVSGVKAYRQGRLLDAIDQFEVAEAEATRIRDYPLVAGVIRRRSAVLETMGDLPGAREAATAALRLSREQRLRRDTVSTLVRLAGVEVRLGLLDDATQHLDEAFAALPQIQEPELEVDALRMRARLHQARGWNSRSISDLELARRVAQQHSLDAPLGQACRDLAEQVIPGGELERGRALLDEARRVFRALDAQLDVASVSVLEGRLLWKEARIAAGGISGADGKALLHEARAKFEQARGLYEDRKNEYDQLFVRTLLYRASFDLREFVDAAEQARRAITLCERLELPGREILARAALGRALCWDVASRQECKKTLNDAIAAAEQHPDVEIRAIVLSYAADVAYQWGADREAMNHAERALEVARDYGLGLSEGEDAALRSELFEGVYATGREAAIGAGDTVALYRFLDKSRASTLVAALGGAESLRGIEVDPQLRADEEAARAAVAQARAALTRASRRRDFRRKKNATDALREAQAALQNAVKAIRRATRSQADLAYGDVTDLAAFRAGLAKGDAALLYLRSFKSASKTPHYLVLRITPDAKAPTLIDLGPAAAIDAQLAQLYASDDVRVDAAAAETLRGLLFKGVDMQGITRLLISPDESLVAVPFPMMQPAVDVALIPSATALGMLKTRAATGATKAIALGRPNYPASDPRKLQDLPETEGEARAVHEALGGELLLRDDANEATFAATLAKQPRWRAVHIACHGMVDMARAARSYLALSIGEGQDGNLHVREVFNLHVPADLVVLSGCETGRGQVIQGDGLTGLMRAFMQAGAPRVICSLWKVDDEATAVLMKRFYAEWKKGSVPAATALRNAQKHVASQPKWAHPQYWAAWVLWGLPD